MSDDRHTKILRAQGLVFETQRERLRAEDELRHAQKRVFETQDAFEAAVDELAALASELPSEGEG
jgi:hypothetical protein